MKFWIEKKEEKNWKYYLEKINIVFFILIVVCFAIFSFYSNITNILFNKNKLDIFKEDLQTVAFYFWSIDEDISKMFLNIDDIVKSYMSGDNVLISKKSEIQETLDYIYDNKFYLSSIWLDNYDSFMSLLSDLKDDWWEVSELLWEKWEYNYLVILQNTNEKRPNWWFFWSFAFITVKDWFLKNLEIVDSYYPDYIAPNTRLMAPEWSKPFLPDLRIWFIAWNKFWFSDIDGSNLKWLYEKMFDEDYNMDRVNDTIWYWLSEKLLHKYIKWVIFIRSDLIEYLIPSFTEKSWEWEFQNANVDLIRGEVRWNKKESYIKEVMEYFKSHSFELFENIINNFDEIVDKNYIQIYLSNVSDNLQNSLLNHWLKSVYDNKYLYSWDTNTSFNKVDWFVKKNIQVFDVNWNIVIDTDKDVFSNENLVSWWDYTMKIYYTLNVPNNYIDYIYWLEASYWIKMTDREKSILALKPALYSDSTSEKWMETKATIYFPQNYEIQSVQWDNSEYWYFYAPFSNWLYYKLLINTNNTTKSVEIKFHVN